VKKLVEVDVHWVLKMRRRKRRQMLRGMEEKSWRPWLLDE